MNIGAKHSLCLISMLSKMQPSESMPTKSSFEGLKSRRTWAGSLIEFGRKVGGEIVVESNRNSRSAPVNRPAVDDRLKQAPVVIIRMRINRSGSLAIVTQSGAHLRIEKVSAGNNLGQQTKAGGIGLLQFSDYLGGRTSARSRQQAFQSTGEIRAER